MVKSLKSALSSPVTTSDETSIELDIHYYIDRTTKSTMQSPDVYENGVLSMSANVANNMTEVDKQEYDDYIAEIQKIYDAEYEKEIADRLKVLNKQLSDANKAHSQAVEALEALKLPESVIVTLTVQSQAQIDTIQKSIDSLTKKD